MRRGAAPVFALLLAASAATDAHAVVKGTSSSLGRYTVRIMGAAYCTGVAIARKAVVTAAHCGGRSMRIVGGGKSVGIASLSRSAVLDDGRRVSVTGDAVILKLSSALPSAISAAPVGDGEGDSFTIAGYGTTDERWRGSFGALHEARLVAAEARALVDPNRTGSIGASACFGDSGGPVMRGGMLVGIITRAAHPHPRIACGHLTRWAAVVASGEAAEITTASIERDVKAEPPPRLKRQRHSKQAQAARRSTFPLLGRLFAPAAEQDGIRRRLRQPARMAIATPQT